MKKKHLTYVYQNGRKNRLAKENYPKEFFYGLDYLKSQFETFDVIEFSKDNNNIILKKFSKFIERITGLPYLFDKIVSSINFKIFRKSDLIVLTNQRIAFSSFPYLLINKFNKKSVIVVFIMGLYNVNHRNYIKNFLRKLSINILIRLVDKHLFLSVSEYEYAKSNHKKHTEKFYFLPFPVDTSFWKKNENTKNYKNILFIGNDGKRDYDFIIELSKKLKEYNFTFITQKIEENQINDSNVTLIKGKWDEEILSDDDIRNFYQTSYLTLLPLKNSLQPSGQSVALQSMSCGTPVIITKTQGFWEPDLFSNYEDIIFVDKNNIESWEKEIKNIVSNDDNYKNLSINGLNKVLENYTLEKFYIRLENILFNY